MEKENALTTEDILTATINDCARSIIENRQKLCKILFTYITEKTGIKKGDILNAGYGCSVKVESGHVILNGTRFDNFCFRGIKLRTNGKPYVNKVTSCVYLSNLLKINKKDFDGRNLQLQISATEREIYKGYKL